MNDRALVTRRSLLTIAGALGVGALAAGCASPKASASRSASAASSSAAPAVSSVSPSSVPLAGGVRVALRGTGLRAVRGVTVGGVAASDVEATDTKVEFTAPHQAMYQAGDQTVELFDQDAAPTPSANSTDGGANGSEVADGVSGATDSGSATPSATASPTAPAGAKVASARLAYAATTPVDRELAYGMQYWQSYNAAYGNMNSIGGDCANFVSQMLLARGFAQTADWYSSDDGTRHSTTWTYAPDLDTWLTENASAHKLTRRTLAERSKVAIGDIIMFDWNANDSPDHTTVVSEVFTEADGTVLVKSVSHNEDGTYRDLDDMITRLHPGGNAWFHCFTA